MSNESASPRSMAIVEQLNDDSEFTFKGGVVYEIEDGVHAAIEEIGYFPDSDAERRYFSGDGGKERGSWHIGLLLKTYDDYSSHDPKPTDTWLLRTTDDGGRLLAARRLLDKDDTAETVSEFYEHSTYIEEDARLEAVLQQVRAQHELGLPDHHRVSKVAGTIARLRDIFLRNPYE